MLVDVTQDATDVLQLVVDSVAIVVRMAVWDNVPDVEKRALPSVVVVREHVLHHVRVIAVKVAIMNVWIRVETHVCLNVQIPALIPA